MLRKNNSSSSVGVVGGAGMKHKDGVPRHHHPKLHTGSLSAGSTKTWNLGRSPRTHNSLSSMGLTPFPAEASESADPEYVMQLVNDVRWFADVLLNLKEAFQVKENQDGLQQVVQERLAELLRVLKAVISKHPTLNSVDILGTAGTVIAKTKGLNYQELTLENSKAIFAEIHSSIETLAFTFGNVVSDFLMGDADSGSGLGIPQTRRSRSFDNLSVEPEEVYVAEKNQITGPDLPLSREEEVDSALLRNDGGVESALHYAKAWSKYIKELLAWMEKRVSMDMEYAKSYAKMAESAKNLASQQGYMPFSDIYASSFKNDVELNQLLLQTAAALQSNKFIQPLLARKNELDRLRKEIKEQWQREQKKMHESDGNLRKALAATAQRREDYHKARLSTSRSQEEQQSRQLEKKRRLEEEAMMKAEEAQDQYQSCAADAGTKRMDLNNVKTTILTQIREMIFQCDLTLKAVTVNWFQSQQSQTLLLPTHFQALSENAKLYEPGECYSEFVRNLPKVAGRSHSDSISSDNARFNKRSVGSTHSSHGNLSQASINSCDVLSADEADGHFPAKTGARRSASNDNQAVIRTQPPLGAWASSSQGSQGGMCSDSESAGGSSESRSMDSPTASPGDFKRRLPRTPSTGTMSSADDLDEREAPSLSSNGLAEMVTETASSPGPFRNAQMSKAAQTHKLRKLRAPSKCRECDSLVVFHGAECEECSLACHKKCLETLAIQCGHKKLQGKLQLFGISFAQASKNSSDGIPFIIKKCTSEIEGRALNIKGIYRVNGAKSRVEKLCQAFENGKELVELSELSPHDISNVLKLYLRQLPEPLILFRHYNDFIGLAKEYQRVMVDEADGPSARLTQVVLRIRDLLRQLPAANFRTMHFLVAHLNRVAEQSEENKMTASNLGIIFGPTLVKPRQTDAEVSLSSLVDYPFQALMVELMVRHFQVVFDSSHLPPGHASSQVSPRLTPQEKLLRLNRHSTSMMDIKENAKVYKRFSSVIPSSHILNEVQEVQPGTDRTRVSECEGLNGVSVEGQRSNLPTTSAPAKVQLRPSRTRQSRPVSMPLERLPAPANRALAGRADADPIAEDPIPELAEPERSCPGAGSSRVSAYYITPFLDTQALQKRAWDRKYKHYDVTPRTAMIVANLPSSSSLAPPMKTTVTVASAALTDATAVGSNPYSVKVPNHDATEDESRSSPLTLRAPRTLQPPPGTFYKPPGRARTVPDWTTTVGTVTTTTTTTATSSHPGQGVTCPPVLTSHTRLQSQDSGDSAVDPGTSSPEDPGETKHVYQRLRSRRMPELEQREAHFV